MYKSIHEAKCDYGENGTIVRLDTDQLIIILILKMFLFFVVYYPANMLWNMCANLGEIPLSSSLVLLEVEFFASIMVALFR